jgi:hypothetical protein
MLPSSRLKKKCFIKECKSPFNDDNRHLHQLQGALPVLERLREVQDLASHDAHLLLEEMPIEATVSL